MFVQRTSDYPTRSMRPVIDGENGTDTAIAAVVIAGSVAVRAERTGREIDPKHEVGCRQRSCSEHCINAGMQKPGERCDVNGASGGTGPARSMRVGAERERAEWTWQSDGIRKGQQ